MIEAPPSQKQSTKPQMLRGSSSPMIAVRSVAKRIGQQEILRGVDLEVATGETLAIIGRSGGGKSVLLKHLVGLMTPDVGEIWIDGHNIIGMKKRVGLARSIIRRPSCVLYDEPTSGLDPVVADSINRLIRRLQQRFGMTSVVVTHDMKSAFDVANHIAYLHEGRIYFHGTSSQLQQSTDRLIQDFLLGRSEHGAAVS